MEAPGLGFPDTNQTLQRREARNDIPLDCDHRPRWSIRKSAGREEMISRLVPSLIVGAVAAAMVLGASLLLFRRVTRVTSLVAVVIAVLVCIGAFWTLR